LENTSSLNVSRDGRILVGANGRAVKIMDLTTGNELHSLTTNELHTSGEPGGLQRTWEGSDVTSVALSPDENLIVSTHEDGTIKLWNAKGAKLKRIIKSRFRDIQIVVFSPDGKLIATGHNSGDSRVDFWSVRTGKRVLSLGEDSDYVSSLSFSGDGSTIVTGHSFKPDLIVWNARTGRPIRKFEQPYSQEDHVALSPDGRFLVSGGENQNVLLWNVQDGRLVWSAFPIDWDTETRFREDSKRRAAIQAAENAEEKRKTRAADKETAAWAGRVSISFHHFGVPVNPLEQHMMEKGELNKSLIAQSAEEAEGVWLRLRNNSPLPISFRTDSFYAPQPGCGIKLKDDSQGLCDGAEVSIQYGITESNGKPVPYGLDMSFGSVLPPGASVLFSVLRAHLTNRRTVFVSYTYLKQNEVDLNEYGSEQRVQFRSSQLSKRR
jgi:hypothetical protein